MFIKGVLVIEFLELAMLASRVLILMVSQLRPLVELLLIQKDRPLREAEVTKVEVVGLVEMFF